VSRTIAVTALVTLTLGLSACGAGFDAQTIQNRPTGNGAAATLGEIDIRDATLVLPDGAKGSGEPSTATLITTFWNNGEADKLTSVAVAPAVAKAASAPLPIELRTNVRTPLSFEPAGKGNPVPQVTFPEFKAARSSWVDVTYTFEKGGVITVPVLTVPATNYYEGIGVELPKA